MLTTNVNKVIGTVVHIGRGEITAQDLKGGFAKAVEHPQFRVGMSIVWDLRRACIASLVGAAVQSLVSFMDARKAERGDGKLAIVVTRDVDFGVARVLQAHALDLPWATHVFRSIEEAMIWIHQP